MNKAKVYEGLATGLSAVRAAEYTRHQEGDIKAIQEAMASLERDNWVSVRRGLPNRGEAVLCVNTRGGRYINTMDLKGHWFYEDGYVTHWQPLPALPR